MLASLVARVRAAFTERFGGEPAVVAQAPGRVNVIGEHVDYTFGLAMPAAIDRHVVVAFRPDRSGRVLGCSLDLPGELDLALPAGDPAPGWPRYAGGVARLFPGVTGGQLVVGGDVPIGSGLSSSAAIEVATANALRAAFGVAMDDHALVRLCQRVEHEFLGVTSGLLDQFGSQFSRPGHVLFVDFRDLQAEAVPARLEGACWVVVDPGVRRALAQSAYMQRVAECAQGLAALGLAHYRDVTLEHLAEVPHTWGRRLRHMVTENARVVAARACFGDGDARRLGALLIASHQSLRDDYAVSCAELDGLVDAALARPECHGARMVGGGFGGCTLNLVAEASADAFCAAMAHHARTTGLSAAVHRFALVGGAGLVDDAQ